jgi:hypothetical protein
VRLAVVLWNALAKQDSLLNSDWEVKREHGGILLATRARPHFSRIIKVLPCLEIQRAGNFNEEKMMRLRTRPPEPIHVSGMSKGEEYALEHGKEPGRGSKQYRGARDATGINASLRRPIHPAMPNIPPA